MERRDLCFSDIEGHSYGYDPDGQRFSIGAGRLLISKQFATELGRPQDAGAIVGEITISAKMRTIESTEIVDGDVKSESLPADLSGTIPGPDVIVGDVYGLSQFGVSGTQVGLAVGTNSCNFGTENLNWIALPSNEHPVIPQNMYRMSGGPNNDERFEQIGQSSVKHAFTALTQNLCALGCNGVGGSRLGSGCSDPYSAGLNAGPSLGSRAWINPFDGAFPRGDSGTSPNTHSGHSHTGTSHRIVTEISDLSTSQNPGAKYFAEGQYITSHEYEWCQTHPAECNMYNNVSYREYQVIGTGSPFSFNPVSNTVRTKPAVIAWPNATFEQFEPAPGSDGIGIVAYKVTNPSPGVWRYEYAVYNQNLDRAVQSFGLPLGSGVTLSSIGFHAPPQHPGSLNDGTMGDAGFSSSAWAPVQTANSITWSSETFAQNQNANAIRWGTMYNFRFESNRPPQTVNATIGFFKTGSPMTVQVQAPGEPVAASVSIAGRVTSASGQGVYQSRVIATDISGNAFSTATNPFGYYRIDGVPPGLTYTVSVSSKGHAFSPQSVPVNSNLTDINFTEELP